MTDGKIYYGDSIWVWTIKNEWFGREGKENFFIKKRRLPPDAYYKPEEVIDVFHTKNIIYYPCHDLPDDTSDLCNTRDFHKVLYSISGDPWTGLNRTLEIASMLGRFSHTYKGIYGMIIDDYSTLISDVVNGKNNSPEPEEMKLIYNALKEYNNLLNLYGCIYTHHLNLNFSQYLPFIDGISLWVRNSQDLINIDNYVSEAMKIFSGKDIYLGLYIYEYSYVSDFEIPLELIKFEFEKAYKYLTEGKIKGFQIMGSYLKSELNSEQCKWISDFIKKKFFLSK